MEIVELLGNRIRLGIITTLYQYGEMTSFELMTKLGTSYRVLNSHLRVLEAAGFVKVRRLGRMKMVRLSQDPRIQTLGKVLIELDGR